jgi:hypothetical protein
MFSRVAWQAHLTCCNGATGGMPLCSGWLSACSVRIRSAAAAVNGHLAGSLGLTMITTTVLDSFYTSRTTSCATRPAEQGVNEETETRLRGCTRAR